ncbi:hypothetical protein E2C01_074356 [Portunus trituberculatus]|uniref:Uncharacterized protein n=1 Tax=Portunus trituberculatus TaxID=210409 RepID=A0A5B7I5G7_PORTR|nr:hypothetical protein [Portunus trituberculatus]
MSRPSRTHGLHTPSRSLYCTTSSSSSFSSSPHIFSHHTPHNPLSQCQPGSSLLHTPLTAFSLPLHLPFSTSTSAFHHLTLTYTNTKHSKARELNILECLPENVLRHT